MFGSDEAGKGPVIGPMVIAAVGVSDESFIPDGVKDSKKLSKKKRRSLDKKMRNNDNIYISTCIVSAEKIDNSQCNINTLIVEAQGEAISKLPSRFSEGVVDSSDTNEERHAKRVTENVSRPVSVRAEHKADDNYDTVAAASIVAKVKRDKIIEQLNKTFSRDIGSGYPSDSTTRSFLRGYFKEKGKLPPIVRYSWSTSKDILDEA